MEKIYSKVEPGVLLHLYNRKDDVHLVRQNLSPSEEYLQVACFTMPKGKTFKPHKHIKQIKTTDIAQESWIVVQGTVRVFYYDLDDSIIKEVDLEPGDCTITFRGGHNYLALEDDTIIYEHKTGPYLGQELDKEFI